MNTIIEEAPTRIRTPGEFDLSPGQSRKFLGVVNRKRRKHLIVHNCSDAGSGNVLKVTKIDGTVFGTVFEHSAEVYATDEDVVVKAPDTNAADVTVNVAEEEYNPRGSVGGQSQSSSPPAPGSTGSNSLAPGSPGFPNRH